MFFYKECEEMVGEKPEYPTKEYGYRAYKNGECKVFNTKTEADDFSKLVERFVVNEEEYNKKLKEYHAFGTKVRLVWLAKLKEEFDLPDEIFDICYAEANDRGHSSGYDEVANCMYDVVEFYEKIMKVIKDE